MEKDVNVCVAIIDEQLTNIKKQRAKIINDIEKKDARIKMCDAEIRSLEKKKKKYSKSEAGKDTKLELNEDEYTRSL